MSLQWDGCDLPATDARPVCADQVGPSHGLLCHLHQSADEDMEVGTFKKPRLDRVKQTQSW